MSHMGICGFSDPQTALNMHRPHTDNVHAECADVWSAPEDIRSTGPPAATSALTADSTRLAYSRYMSLDCQPCTWIDGAAAASFSVWKLHSTERVCV